MLLVVSHVEVRGGGIRFGVDVYDEARTGQGSLVVVTTIYWMKNGRINIVAVVAIVVVVVVVYVVVVVLVVVVVVLPVEGTREGIQGSHFPRFYLLANPGRPASQSMS